MRWSGAVVCLPLVVAGCIGAIGGDGGAAGGDGSVPHLHFIRSGSGGEARSTGNELIAKGEDGCDVMSDRGSFVFCAIRFKVRGTAFAVEQPAGLGWGDLGVAVNRTGFVLRTADASVPMDRRVDYGTLGGDPMPGPVHEGRVEALLGASMAAGQEFEVCGDGKVTLWMRDARGGEALAGFVATTPPCWTRPFGLQHRGHVLVNRTYDLTVSGGPDGGLLVDMGNNCVGLPPLDLVGVEATATWTPQAEVAGRLHLRVRTAESPDGIVGPSPLHGTFAREGGNEPVDVAVFVPDGGAALDQAVRLDLMLTFNGEPKQEFYTETASCRPW